MATIRQKKLAKAIVDNVTADKPLNKQELVVSVGYSPVTADVKAGEVMEQKGVQEALAELGFTEENAMRVVTEIMLDREKEANARLKATDQVFKVRGSYAPEKSIAVTMALNEEHKTKATNAIRQLFSRGDTE